jgi:hypothetical protein
MTQTVGTNDEEVTGSKQLFFIFPTFFRYTTTLRGTLVENVNKVKIQRTLLVSHFKISIGKLKYKLQLILGV